MTTLTMTPSDKLVPFDTIGFGKPFFYMDTFWVRSSTNGGTDISQSDRGMGSCVFFIELPEDRIDHPDLDDRGFIMISEVDIIRT